MNNNIHRILLACMVLVLLPACKDLAPILEKVKPMLEHKKGQSSSISTQQMIDAIKQALTQGVGDSVNLLGSAKGFSLSDVYHIPIPESLNKPSKILRQLGQGKYVTEFEERLNLAAEQSVTKAIPVFSSAIKGMSVSDALTIMKGSDNAATMYFKDKTSAKLREQFLPIIQTATGKTGLTSSYKKVSDKISTYAPAYRSKLVDIDDYVLNKAMSALFDRVAIEEKLIREQPAKRTTELMKSVFGHFAK